MLLLLTSSDFLGAFFVFFFNGRYNNKKIFNQNLNLLIESIYLYLFCSHDNVFAISAFLTNIVKAFRRLPFFIAFRAFKLPVVFLLCWLQSFKKTNSILINSLNWLYCYIYRKKWKHFTIILCLKSFRWSILVENQSNFTNDREMCDFQIDFF